MNDPFTGSQITIFHNGRVCICDITELQARAIIWHARREMDEEKICKNPAAGLYTTNTLLYGPPPPPPPLGVSMKRSLQRFLQRRKDRIQATSPYNQ